MFNSRLSDAFADEMEKIALGNIGAAAATLGAVGSIAGGALGYQQAKAEGKGTTDALLGAGKGALVGGVGAGAVGAGLGAGSRLARGWKHVDPTMAAHTAQGVAHQVATGVKPHSFMESMDRRIGDVGRRQLHALTGYVPKEVRGLPTDHPERINYLRNIGVGGRGPLDAAATAAKDDLAKFDNGGKGPQGMLGDFHVVPRFARHGLAKWDNFSARHSADAQKELIEAGATSIPGAIKAMWNPELRKRVLPAVGKDIAYGGGALGTAMMGQGIYGAYKGVAGEVQPGQEGMGYGERVGDSIGGAAGWLLPSPIPMAGQMAGGQILSKTFGGLGSIADRIAGGKPRAPLTDPTDPVASTANQLGGVQSTTSPSAAGKPYGGGMDQ